MITLVRVELLKLRTTPALAVTAIAALALTLLSAVSNVLLAGQNGYPPLGSEANVTKVFTQPAACMAMAMFILGILLIGNEFRQRTIIGTYLAEPRRGYVLVAKLITMTAVGAALSALVFGATYAVVVPLYANKGVHHLDGSVAIGTVAFGTVIGGALFGLIGVALGALTRNSIAAIIGGLVWIQLIEIAILENAVPSLAKWLPTGAAQALTFTQAGADLLTPANAALVLVAWGVAIAVAATAISSRREVR
jgi:ABC-type transport system involved in multi-copper enzyme maturation permease subunit